MDGRYIPAIDPGKPVGPQLFDRFQQGDMVSHIRLGSGVVTRKDDEYIVVKYATKFLGEYDVGWFDKYPNYLFHSGERTPVGCVTARG